MPAVVSCPACGSKLRLPDELPGRDVRCPRCDATFDAAAPPVGAPAAGPAEPVDGPPSPFGDAPPPRDAGPQPPPRRPAVPRLNDAHDDLRACPSCGKH